ncbi:penicillin acylase family protein [Sorangium sp. So ce291]|uniref:penicillin acylase family protein n=1 Tax=Sorangium sp. So ce291 TaxID=3133294 RepID=UPI003F636D4D
MRRRAHAAFLGLVTLSLLGVPGCADEEVNPMNPDTTTTGEPPRDGIALAGLEGDVEVVVDDRGAPHIYATTFRDAVMMQGYLMARDRFPQMEMIRRNVTGRLAEFIGPLSPEALQADIAARVIGFKRIADRIYDELPADDLAKVALDAFAAGVNVYVQEVRDGEVTLPDGAYLLTVLLLSKPEVFTDWTPQDSLAIGRFLAHTLSYDADEKVQLTRMAAVAAATFPAGDPRAGIFRDFYSFAPAQAVFTRDGFPNVGMDTGTRAVLPKRFDPAQAPQERPGGPPSGPPLPALDVLTAAQGFFDVAGRLRGKLGDEFRGSNNWVVSGARTASGAPLLANDPHLSLPSPPLFWYAHLNTARAGGDLNVQGLALAGLPGVLLGYNDHIAWGATTAGHDVTDVYEETITEGKGGAADTVLFNGEQVPLEIVTETIKVAGKDDVVIELERVPHHGFIIPTLVDGKVEPRTSTTALSVRWTGDEPSGELGAFLGLDLAKDVDEAQAALEQFEVGAQSFVVIDRAGDIFWSTQSRVPIRAEAAMTWDPETGTGLSPAMVLPGDGSAEWIGTLEDRYLPHDLNPPRGFIATANNDLVGVTADGDPFNDPHYIGHSFDPGYRIARITERLEELTAAGGVTPEDMSRLQGDHQSPLGRLLAPSFVGAAARAAEERAAPGTHPELTALLAAASSEDLDALAAAAARLSAWTSHETPAGVDIGDGAPPASEVEDSVAATIFNVSMLELVPLAFGDEATALGAQPSSAAIARVLQNAILAPQQLATFDPALGDTVLWDDLATPDMESRDERIVRAMLEAVSALRDRLGADMAGWEWGRLHTVRFASQVPMLAGGSPVTLPTEDDPKFPGGFPRPGDNFGVDAANFGMWDTDSFDYGHGAVQRLVVEMTPDGPRAWNALPGGQHFAPESPHHADEAEHWRRNQAPEMYFTDQAVRAHQESRLVFVPGG